MLRTVKDFFQVEILIKCFIMALDKVVLSVIEYKRIYISIERKMEMNNEINIKSLVMSIFKHAVWLIMVPLVCASVMFAVLSFQGSTYTASVDFLSKNNTTKYDYNISSLQQAKKTEIDNYSKILTSDQVLSRVSQQLATKHGMAVSISEIRSMITISVPEGTSVMAVTVTDDSTEIPEKVCQSLSEIFVPMVEESYEKENILECLSKEFIAKEKKPDLIKPSIVAAGIGFVLSFAVCFFIAYNDKTVRTAEEAKKLLEIPVIGIIPR